ncbi:MAG: hypothetical protein Q7T86_03215 [Hyphomicrobiaceae bacterium]|nr:hypothetical protein [Hyphomicrobiaceae bacterium]
MSTPQEKATEFARRCSAHEVRDLRPNLRAIPISAWPIDAIEQLDTLIAEKLGAAE